MITPSHLIYSWALAKTTERHDRSSVTPARRTSAFILGGLVPDVAIYVFFIWNGLILGLPHEIMWNDLYFNSNWSVFFTLSHSLLLWPLVYLLCRYQKWWYGQWLAAAALLHIVIDFCVHTADAYAHFWPLTNWRFISPVSYWNSAEYGAYVSAFDSILILILLTYLWRTHYRNSKRVILLMFGLCALYLVRLVAEPLFMYGT